MTNDVKKAIESLKAISPRLNQKTDKISELVREIETFLNRECSIGLSAKVEFHSVGISASEDACKSISYCRCGAQYRIAINEEIEHYEVFENEAGEHVRWIDNSGEARFLHTEVTSITPWLECSRELRLESFPRLPDLIEAIVKKAENTINNIERAEGTLNELLDGLNPE